MIPGPYTPSGDRNALSNFFSCLAGNIAAPISANLVGIATPNPIASDLGTSEE